MAAQGKSSSGPSGDAAVKGLLRAVISSLSTGGSKEVKNKDEIKELQKKFEQSDKKLDSLLSEHHSQLTVLINAFTRISGRLNESKGKIGSIKENLHSCKHLLHCKRDELRKFWLDGLEQNTVADMLEDVQAVRNVPDLLEGYTERKHYLHATDTLCKSLSLLRGELVEVTALSDVEKALVKWKQQLLQKITDELSEQVYVKSVKGTVVVFKRFGSYRGSGKAKGASVTTSTLEQNVAEQEITEDLTSDPEADRSLLLAILIECLAKLNEIPSTIAELRSHLQMELLDVIRRASQQFVDCAYNQGEINLAVHEQPGYLLELLELVFEQFRCVVHSHNVIIRNLKRVKNSKKYNCKNLALYDITEVWSKIQTVIQLVLEEYFADKADRQLTSRPSRHLLSDTDIPVTRERLDINAYFNRRRPRQKKESLFLFSSSSHAISMENYLREQRTELYEAGDVTSDSAFSGQPLNLVCKPAVTNITAVFKTIESFTNEVEMAIGCDTGTCNLHKYVTNFIRNKFNAFIHESMSRSIAEQTEGFDSLKNVIDVRRQRELSAPQPLLQSTVTVMECVQKLSTLMQDLPDYSDYFLTMLRRILEDYRNTSAQSYQGVVKSTHDPEQVVISATWAKDDDISRFLRSLPNWQHVNQNSEDVGLGISDDERRALNLKESQILTSNLSSQDAMISSYEILADPVQLKLIGNLHESLEWLTNLLRKFLQSVPVEGRRVKFGAVMLDIPEIEESVFASLTSLVDSFMELTETCLLVLHLEVRVHCFYYLMPVAKQSNYYGAIDDMDADSNVVKLNRDLTGIEEVMKQSLQMKKFQYIFEGLGHLVSSLLINSVQYLKRINENGVKKMCRNIFAIQQSLTNVTSSREFDLDLAKQYYELLNLNLDQIIMRILEHGAKFTELEYINLMSLIKRSKPGISDEMFAVKAQKLKDAVTEKHVYHV